MLASQSLALVEAQGRTTSASTRSMAALQEKTSIPAVGVGIDIVDVRRLQMLYERWQAAFLTRLFTEQEQVVCRNATGYRWYSLAGRFSAKEAVKKILASHGEMARWIDIEILNGRFGEPFINLHGEAKAALQRTGYTSLTLSISHDANMATAMVVAYS